MAVGLWPLSTYPAYADLVTLTPSVSFSDTVSVTDAEGGATSTTNDNASLGSSALEQFDTSTGVLTGVTINLDSTRTQTVTVSSTAGGGTGSNPNVTSDGSGSSTAGISAPGVNYTFTTAISAGGSCTGKYKQACGPTATTAADVATDQNQAASGSLDSYVGNGTVTVSRTAPTLSASQSNNAFTGAETTQYDLTWAGNLSATYSYLLHAAPSFDNGASVGTLTLNFGTVAQNSSVDPLGFSIYNLSAIDRAGLDLDGFSLTGGIDTSALDSNLAAFTNLGQGGNQTFQATFDTTNVGSFLETYTLTLSDADVGAATSRSSYTLVLTLAGKVTAVSSVPIPDTVWLFGSGLIGVVGISRRQSKNTPGIIKIRGDTGVR